MLIEPVNVAVAVACIGATYGVGLLAYRLLVAPFFWHLKHLPGPKNPSLIFGNTRQLNKSNFGERFLDWIDKYGHVMQFKAAFNTDRILTTDLRAISHVFTHSTDYQKPELVRVGLGRLIGEGVLVTEGEQHRLQRRTMNPSFAPMQLRLLTPIFFEKSQQLRDILQVSLGNETQTVNILPWLSRATLDIIGLAGFAYNFHALDNIENPSDLSQAISVLFNAEDVQIFALFQHLFPVLRHIPTKRARQEIAAQNTIKTIGRQLISDRKNAILREREGIVTPADMDDVKPEYGVGGRDLMSVLIKANMDPSLPESQRLSDEDVLAQIPTFTVAGHETTSTETTWCLFCLATNPVVQSKLRRECLSVASEAPSMDELMGLPYLDAVVRETMRVHPAVRSTGRVVMKDDIIPLNEPYVDRKGETHSELHVKKDDAIIIPIMAVNRSKLIWGDDADQFNPDRWIKAPEESNDIPGVWGNILTFLGGARSCIGYKFAIIEMKALIFTLVRSFEFEMAVPAQEIFGRSLVVTRPYVLSQPEKGAQLPLRIKPYKPAEDLL